MYGVPNMKYQPNKYLAKSPEISTAKLIVHHHQ